MPKRVSKGIKHAEHGSKKPFGLAWVENQNIDRMLDREERDSKKAPSMPKR